MTPGVRAALAALLLGLSAATHAAGQQAKPDIPLWQLEPFDKIELFNGDVHDIDPVRIPADAELKLEAKAIIAEREDEAIYYVGRPGLLPPDEIKGEKRGYLYRIRLQEDGSDWYVFGRDIRRIDHYENLLLRDAHARMEAGKLEEAYDFLKTIEARDADWPGLLEAKIRLHRGEADGHALAGRREVAFWYHREEKGLIQILVARNPEMPAPRAQLTDVNARIDQVSHAWVESVVARGDFAEGRKIVARLETVTPTSPAAKRWRAEYAQRANALIEESVRQQQGGNLRETVATLERAADVFPDSPRVRSALTAAYKSYPVLKVAVEHVPRYDRGPAAWSSADKRCATLLHIPLVDGVGAEDGQLLRSRIVEALEKSNINRRASVKIRRQLVWPGDGKPVTAVDVARLLAQCCRRSSPLYHPALARLVVNIETQLPDHLTIEFDRPQFRPGSWLQVPFLRISHDPSLAQSLVITGTGWSGLGPFRPLQRRDDRVDFVANRRFIEADHPIVQQIIELEHETSAERLRALQDRKVDMVAYVPPRQHDRIKKIPGARLVRVAHPRVHVIQFNLDRRELRHRTLRRAIDYAIDRAGILETLRVKIDDDNRILTGPMLHDSFAYNASVEIRPHDPYLAKALIQAARKELRVIGQLTLAHSGNESSRTACEAIVRSLNEIGLSARLIDLDKDPGVNPFAADLRYQSYRLSDPVYDVLTLLTRDNPTLAEHGSSYLRHLLTELAAVPNESTARTLLPLLHQTLHDDSAILPLWQWVDHFAVSDAISELPDKPETVYHRVDEWSVAPQFPESHWKSIAVADN